MSHSESKINRKLNSVAAYIANKAKKFSFIQRVKPSGEWCYVIGGNEFSQAEINEQFPTDMDLRISENSDGRNNWMANKKSY